MFRMWTINPGKSKEMICTSLSQPIKMHDHNQENISKLHRFLIENSTNRKKQLVSEEYIHKAVCRWYQNL
jgi:hypothetical protein